MPRHCNASSFFVGRRIRSPWFGVAVSSLATLGLAAVVNGQVTLQAPETAPAGSAIEVSWSGGGADGDFVSIDPAGAPHREYGTYVYASKGSPATLNAPDEPGAYEVRYHLKAGYEVAATAPLEVVDVEATIDVPPAADAGGTIVVRWEGPGYPRDFISVDPEGAEDRTYGVYAYTKAGNPLELRLPNEPGTVEVRYHLGRSYRVIGRATVEVREVFAEVEVPERVAAGEEVSVSWTGPGGDRDFLSIDEVGSPDKAYGRYVYVHQGNPVAILAPDAPGDYVIRYHLGTGDYTVIGEANLTVGEVTASVSAPAEVVAHEPFEVIWDGPNHPGDYVTLVPVGTPEGEYGPYGYTKRGSPTRIRAPKEPGEYVVRYQTGQSNRVLATADATTVVVPGHRPGRLRVRSSSGSSAASGADRPAGAIEVILDASGSMLQRIEGTRRIELARAALLELTQSLPEEVPFALRVFGHREADSCRTDLEISLAPLDRTAAAGQIRSIEAKNLAKTPIAASLSKVAEDLKGVDGPHLVILVTDGEETCGGDPQAAIASLRDAGIDVRVNIVGFAIGDLATREDFERWARIGGGSYVDAADGQELARAVRDALRPPFEILGENGVVVGGGLVDGRSVELSPGRYLVRLLTNPFRDLGWIDIVADEETVLENGD